MTKTGTLLAQPVVARWVEGRAVSDGRIVIRRCERQIVHVQGAATLDQRPIEVPLQHLGDRFRIERPLFAFDNEPQRNGRPRWLHAPPHVECHSGLKTRDEIADDLDIAVASQRRLIEESPPQRQPVARADDSAAGDTGKDLDMAKDIQLRQTRQTPR
jgi:hypothetical protein